ncbi:MAG TPA: sugar phosphate isomerase/epimerase, partial [Roseiflexaceae bacterium]|nr:sugar phosphate isomerase/epimerase [Roseiflexaceae bacterium]
GAARELRAQLDSLGLKACSAHVALTLFENELDRTIETYQALGCSLLVVPSIPEQLRGDWAGLAATLNRLAGPVAAAGMRLAYHNHDFELREQNGKTGLDILLEQTDPRVNFELDCGWVHKAGRDPLTEMRKLAGRLPLIHVKDVAANGDWAEVGYGAIDYRPIVAAAPAAGVEWLIVEQDTSKRSPLESIGMSIKWLREHTT